MSNKRLIAPAVHFDFQLNPHSIGEGLTQSEMQTQDNCGEKWYLGYNLMLARKQKFSWALTYGSWIHAALEEFYASKGKRWKVDATIPKATLRTLSLENQAKYEYWQKLAKLQMDIYASHYKGDFKFFRVESIEEKVDYTFDGVRLKGMIDLFVYSNGHKGYYVVDHKTTSRLDKTTVDGWDFRLQFMFYCWLASKLWPKKPVRGFFINAIKKPALRQGEAESTVQFLQRVQTDMLANPEKYLYRDRLILKKDDLAHFEETILQPKLERVKLLMNPKIPDSVKFVMLRNKNTDHCTHYGQPCEFLPICKNGMEVEQHAYKVRENKHEELIESIE